MIDKCPFCNGNIEFAEAKASLKRRNTKLVGIIFCKRCGLLSTVVKDNNTKAVMS